MPMRIRRGTGTRKDLDLGVMMDTRGGRTLRTTMSLFGTTVVLLFAVLVSVATQPVVAFSPHLAPSPRVATTVPGTRGRRSVVRHMAKLTDQRKRELGVADNEDEYDLEKALDANTDPLITKIITGSLLVVLTGLLTVAVILPLSTTPTDGMCNPILNGGRCL